MSDRFSIEYTGGFNPFTWPDLICPICRDPEAGFVSVNHAGVYCTKCNSRFIVRATAGDPGCVVDCFADENVYAPVWRCSLCGMEATFMDWQKPECPNGHKERHTMEKDDYIQGPWKPPKGHPKSYYLVLKLGDYCSGWLGSDWVKYPEQSLGFPTQEEWDRFQIQAGMDQATHIAICGLV